MAFFATTPSSVIATFFEIVVATTFLSVVINDDDGAVDRKSTAVDFSERLLHRMSPWRQRLSPHHRSLIVTVFEIVATTTFLKLLSLMMMVPLTESQRPLTSLRTFFSP